MAINYSMRKSTTGNGVDSQKLRPRFQSVGTLSLEQVAQYAANHYGGMVDKLLVMKVVEMLGKSVVDKLKDGYCVSLGDLGTYFPNIKGVAKTAQQIQDEGYHPKRDIEEVSVKWKKSTLLKEEITIDNVDLKQASRLDIRKAMMKESEKRPEM